MAATRARSMLIMTGSYWYGLPEPTVNAKKPSELFDLVEQHPVTRNEGHVDEPPRPALLRFAAGTARRTRCSRTVGMARCGPRSQTRTRFSAWPRRWASSRPTSRRSRGCFRPSSISMPTGRDSRRAGEGTVRLGDRSGHLCPVPEAILLVRGRPTAPSSQPGGSRRHRVASPDRASSERPGSLRRFRARPVRRHGRSNRWGRFQGLSRFTVRDRGRHDWSRRPSRSAPRAAT